MADEMNPGATQPPNPFANLSLDVDDDVQKQAVAALGNPPAPKPRNTGAPVSSLWDRFVQHAPLTTAVGRGVLNAVDEMSNTLVGAGVAISKKTGAYKIGRTPEEEQAFLHAWERPTKDVNPLQFHEDNIDRWLGPRRDGIPAMVESIAQFATGVSAESKVLDGMLAVPKLSAAAKLADAGGITKGLSAAAHAAKLAAVDMTAFDPHGQRLADAVQGTVLENPVSRMLAHSADDSEMTLRIKAGLEGVLLGSSIDYFVGKIKTLRAVKSGDPQAVLAAAKEAEAARDAAIQTEPLGVQKTPEGHFGVIINDHALPTLKAGEYAPEGVLKSTATPAADPVTFTSSPRFKAMEEQAQKEAEARFEAWSKNNPESALKLTTAQQDARIKQFQKRVLRELRDAGGVQPLEQGKPGSGPAMDLSGATTASENPIEVAGGGGKGSRAKNATFAPRTDFGAGPFGGIVPGAGTASGALDGPVYPTRAEAEAVAATGNLTIRTERTPSIVQTGVTPDLVDSWRKAKAALDAGQDTRSAADIMAQTGLNINYLASPQETINSMVALADAAPETNVIARGRRRSWKETRQVATDLFGSSDPAEGRQMAARLFGDTQNLDARIDAVRTMVTKYSQDVLTPLARAMDGVLPEDNPLAYAKLSQAVDWLHEVGGHLTGSKSEIGRALNANKMRVGEGGEAAAQGASGGIEQAAPQASASLSQNLTASQIRELAKSLLYAEHDPEAIMKVLQGTAKASEVAATSKTTYQTARDVALSYRMESMLSGPRTMATNTLSNQLAMMLRPAEYWWAGVRSKNPELRQAAADMVQLGALSEDMRESWRAFRKVFSQGTNVLDSSDPHGTGSLLPIAAWRVGTDDGNLRMSALNALQILGRMPSRVLMSTDEMFKQMNYRMAGRARILRMARDRGVTDPTELARVLKDQKQYLFTGDGAAVNPWALNYARVATFTNDLQGPIGQGIQAMVQKVPELRLIMPFVKTPLNIWNFTLERTPLLNRLSAAVRDDLASGDPERVALAKAKTDIGVMTWASAFMLAKAGGLTGGGPTDPQLRKQWRDAGNQPYSVKVGDSWYSLKRADPVLTTLGIAADLVEMSGEWHDGEHEPNIGTFIASVASNAMSKSYLQGLSDFFDAVSSGQEASGQKFLNNIAGSFIPNGLRQMDPDPVVHETRTWADELKARLPGYSADLEAHRNLFGEKVMRAPGYWNASVNPVTIMPNLKDDDVSAALLKLNKAFPTPAQKLGSIDLTDRVQFADRKLPDGQVQSPYDRMLEIMVAPPNGMPSLRERLSQVIQSDAYKHASGESTILPGGMRYTLAAKVIHAYQTYAREQMLSEYPSLRHKVLQNGELRGAALANGQEGVNGILKKYGDLFSAQQQQ